MSITAALALVWACRAPAPPASLLLVTLDTTRADHIGAYGATNAHTPTLDGLARAGLRMERAYATVPLTIPSHSSMMTGLYPTRHGVRTNGDAVLADSFDTLAERLRAAGYRTAASVSAFVTTRMWGFNQGFDAYFDALPARASSPVRWALQRPADAVVADATAWLGSGDGPYFLWVHFYDAHDPYTPPEPWASRMPDRPYDAEIAFIDAQLGALLPVATAAAGAGGLNVIAIGDHGEALGEVRGEPTHGTLLAEATTRVPFLVRPAQALKEARTEANFAASVADVMPTALGLLGLPVPAGLDGVDLSPLLRGETVRRPGVYLESYAPAQRYGYHPEIAWIKLPFKLLDTPHARLWDLSADPHEARDLASERPTELARLRASLEAATRDSRAPSSGGVAPELAEQLAALGYVGGEIRWSDIDLRDHLATVEALARAQLLKSRSRSEGLPAAEAEAAFRAILEKEPQLREARFALAELLEARGERDQAESLLTEAIALQEDSTALRSAYAGLLARAGRFDEALVQTELILRLVPLDEGARVQSLRLLIAAGREGEAIARARGWRADGSLTPATAAPLGVVLSRLGDPDAAEILQFSLSDGVARPAVQQALAMASLTEGDLPAGIGWLRAELESWPDNTEARLALAQALMEVQDWEEAAAEYRFLSDAAPDDVELRRVWAQAVFNTADYDLAQEVLAPALLLAPDNPRVLMLQANILGKQGHMQEGQAMAEQAQQLFELEQSSLR